VGSTPVAVSSCNGGAIHLAHGAIGQAKEATAATSVIRPWRCPSTAPRRGSVSATSHAAQFPVYKKAPDTVWIPSLISGITVYIQWPRGTFSNLKFPVIPATRLSARSHSDVFVLSWSFQTGRKEKVSVLKFYSINKEIHAKFCRLNTKFKIFVWQICIIFLSVGNLFFERLLTR